MRIFGHRSRPAPGPRQTPGPRREQYETASSAASGIIASTREMHERNAPDPTAGIRDLNDTCLLREVKFTNGLTLQEKPAERKLDVLEPSADGPRVVASFPEAGLWLPSAGDPNLCIHGPGEQEWISPDGAVLFQVASPSAGPDSVYEVSGDQVAGMQVGEPIDIARGPHEPGYVYGYYEQPVSRVSGEVRDGVLYLAQAGEQIPAYVTPHQLGDPKPAKPLHNDAWQTLSDALGAPPEEEKKPDPVHSIVGSLSPEECRSLLTELQARAAQADRPAGTVERHGDTVSVNGIPVPVRSDPSSPGPGAQQ